LAKEELKQAVALRDENIKILDTLIESNREGNNKEQINARNIRSAELELQIYKSQNNVIRAHKAERAADAKRSQEAGGGLLGASRSGQQALETARKVRARENKIADFKTQEKVFEGMQEEENRKRAKQGLPPISRMGIMEREAAKQAAGEAPSLSEKLLAGQTGQSPAQLATEQAKGGGGSDSQKQLLDAINELNKKIPAAVAQ
jgi:hypothetical protein